MSVVAGAIRPSYHDFTTLAQRGNVVPISCEILGDLETPVSAFLKIHRGRHGFLLESVQGGEKWGRYSFLGSEPERIWTARSHGVEVRTREGVVDSREVPDVLEALREWLRAYRPVALPGLPRFSGGAVGYLGYDLVREFEKLPARARDDLELPEVVLLLADRLLVFDNVTQKIQIIANLFLQEGMSLRAVYDAGVAGIEEWLARLRGPLPDRVASLASSAVATDGTLRSNLSQAEYEAMVRRAKEYVHAGDVIQVVLAQRFEGQLRAAPFDVYRSLRSINPSPYLFFLDLGDVSLAGASPEVMVRVEEGEVIVRPIAGTRPRGTVERDDLALEHELLNDRRRSPSTSCSSTSVATTLVGSPPSARSESPSGSSWNAILTSCTSSRTCEGGWPPGGTRSTPFVRRSPRARSQGRRRYERCRSSRSSNRCGAASMAEPSATSPSPATWIRGSRSAWCSSRTGARSCKPARGSSPIQCRSASTSSA